MTANFISGLWELIKEVWGWFEFMTFIDAWEEGILLRRGKFVRVVKPGIVFHLPFEIDEIHSMNVKPTALELEEQSLTTGDSKEIVCRAVLMWSIFDIKKCTIDVEDAQETLGDIAVGVIQEMVEQQDWDYIRTPEFRSDMKRAIQKQARKWGITVSTVKFQDLTLAATYRIFGGVAA